MLTIDQINKLETDNKKYKDALIKIKELNITCADCKGTACGVCSNADGKPSNSYKIAAEVLKESEDKC